jgi:uncharacterized repeat protein (TIGR01451 family)
MKRALLAACAAAFFASPALAGNITWHGGNVQVTSTTHAIFWLPPGQHFEPTTGNAATDAANDTRYENFMIRYLQNVGGSDLYNTTTQYTGANGQITNVSTFAGSTVDTNAYPHAGTTVDPLGNDDLQNEVDAVRAAQGWPAGDQNGYFIFTANGIQSCFNSSNCSYNAYCAYHYWFDGTDGAISWANMPEARSLGGCGSANVTGDNDADADIELDVLSHEHLEMVTDPQGDGWYDTNYSGENGDKCVRTYGIRNSIGANIYMNNFAFQLQREWSNAISGCAMSYETSAPFINQPTLQLSASLAPATFPGNPGDALVYTLTVTNPSNAEAATNLVLNTTLPAGLTRTGGASLSINVGNLAVHDSATYAINVTPGSWLLDGSVETVSTVAGYQDILGNVRPDIAASDSSTVVNAQPTLNLPGPQTQDYHDALTFGISATDVNAGDTITLTASGLPAGLTFTDNGNRTGTVSGTLTATPGVYTATFTANDHHHTTLVNGTVTITVTTEETTLTYTGPTVILQGGSGLTLQARLLEDGTVAPNPFGQTIHFTIGSDSCNGTTDATGLAQCSVIPTGPLGNETITSTFAGDTYYKPSSDSDTVIVFSFPSRGAFAVGDRTLAEAGPSATVTWWSDSWWALNSLTGGTAPLSFKGFAGVVTTLPTTSPANVCGTTFKTGPGNSPPPTEGVPSYMGVLVATSATKSGSTVNGTWSGIVVVKTDPGYSPSPGHPGTGTIVGVFC